MTVTAMAKAIAILIIWEAGNISGIAQMAEYASAIPPSLQAA